MSDCGYRWRYDCAVCGNSFESVQMPDDYRLADNSDMDWTTGLAPTRAGG